MEDESKKNKEKNKKEGLTPEVEKPSIEAEELQDVIEQRKKDSEEK